MKSGAASYIFLVKLRENIPPVLVNFGMCSESCLGLLSLSLTSARLGQL